jgi:hypothetical protein
VGLEGPKMVAGGEVKQTTGRSDQLEVRAGGAREAWPTEPFSRPSRAVSLGRIVSGRFASLHDRLPSGRASGTITSKVAAYFEYWHRKVCGGFQPPDLSLSKVDLISAPFSFLLGLLCRKEQELLDWL